MFSLFLLIPAMKYLSSSFKNHLVTVEKYTLKCVRRKIIRRCYSAFSTIEWVKDKLLENILQVRGQINVQCSYELS